MEPDGLGGARGVGLGRGLDQSRVSAAAQGVDKTFFFVVQRGFS